MVYPCPCISSQIIPPPLGNNEGNPVLATPCTSLPTPPPGGDNGGNHGGGSPKPPIRRIPPPGPKPPPPIVEPVPPDIPDPDAIAIEIPPQEPDIRVQLTKKIIPPVLVQTKSIFTLDPSEPPTTPDLVDPFDPPSPPVVVETNDDVWINSVNYLTNNNTPSVPVYTENTIEIVETGGNNTPQINKPTEVTFNNSINFSPTNGAYEIFDRGHNLDIESNSTILNLANTQGPTNGEVNIGRLLKDFINLTLSNLLDTKYESTIPYNGVSVGSILYKNNLLQSSLTTEAGKLLRYIRKYNLTSLHASTYLIQGLFKAVINGTLENYSLEFLEDIIKNGFISFPEGIPSLSTPLLSRPAAYNMIETRKNSLYPAAYTNGTASRMAQMYYIIPTDIDLTLKIITVGGLETGVRFNMARNLEIPTVAGTTAKVPDNGHEFLEIITRQGKKIITLNSLRDISYQYSIPDLSMIQGLLSSHMPEYGVVLEASATNDDILDNIEVTGVGQDISLSMLFELIPSSLTNLDSQEGELRITQAKYKLTWDSNSGESVDVFNSTVSGYSGPRQWYYLNAADPMVPYILEQDADGETYLTATYNNIDVQLLDINIPRRINKDFMISFTDQAKYDPFSGGSYLDTFSSGSPLKRTVTMIPTPFAEVQVDSYAQTVKASNGKDVSNQTDIWAFSFEKSYDETQKLKDFSINNTDFTTSQSILGEALTNISSLNVNYDLSTGKGIGKGIPNGDFYSLLPFNKVIKLFNEIPSSVVQSIFAGNYNGIEIFSVKRNDLEPTFITSSRLKEGGADMEAQQIQKEVPSIPYFPLKYRDTLIYGVQISS